MLRCWKCWMLNFGSHYPLIKFKATRWRFQHFNISAFSTFQHFSISTFPTFQHFQHSNICITTKFSTFQHSTSEGVHNCQCWQGCQHLCVPGQTSNVENSSFLKCWNLEILKSWNLEILNSWTCWNVDILKSWNIETLKMLTCWNAELWV